MLGNLIGGVIVITIGITLYPQVRDAMLLSQQGNQTNNAGDIILSITNLFFIIGIAAAGICLAYQGLRAARFIGSDEEETTETTDEEGNYNIQTKEINKVEEEIVYVKENKYPFHVDGVCQLTGKKIDSDEECKECNYDMV